MEIEAEIFCINISRKQALKLCTVSLEKYFQGLDMAGAAPSGEGWLWEEKDGDNRCYVERLAPGWFYYKMQF